MHSRGVQFLERDVRDHTPALDVIQDRGRLAVRVPVALGLGLGLALVLLQLNVRLQVPHAQRRAQ